MCCDQNHLLRFFEALYTNCNTASSCKKWKTCHVSLDTFYNVSANTGIQTGSWKRIQTSMVLWIGKAFRYRCIDSVLTGTSSHIAWGQIEPNLGNGEFLDEVCEIINLNHSNAEKWNQKLYCKKIARKQKHMKFNMVTWLWKKMLLILCSNGPVQNITAPCFTQTETLLGLWEMSA